MKKKIFALCAIMLLASGCGKVPKLDNGKEAIVSFKNGDKISVDDFYSKLKDEMGLNTLITMIDTYICETEFKDYKDTATKNAQAYIDAFIEQYGGKDKLLAALQSRTNYQTIDAYQNYLYLANLQSHAIEEYAKTKITDKEIEAYYKDEAIGDMEINHILITSDVKDEVVLCLNYDGKFGLNNINSYFQNANPNGEAIIWQSWRFKKGDKILFNDNSRFTYLYNNLKGIIVDIEKTDDQIAFIIDVETIITEQQCKSDQIEYIDTLDEKTRIKLIVYAFDEDEIDDEEDAKKTIIPFQLAYAVSIHKAQGLEYDSVKVVIPSVNTEKITKGVFYTAITRTKKKLTIYWSSETMEAIISGFSSEHNGFKSLEIIKNKLVQTTSSS